MKRIEHSGAASLVFILLAVLVKLSGWGLYGQVHLEQPPDPAVEALGSGFISNSALLNGVTLHYVRGGQGPVVVLIHGFPQDWFEYHAIMPRLAKHFTVIAVDLRGVGASKATSGGYDDATMADDIHQLISRLKLERVYIVGHDIGGHVAYAFLRRYPEATRGAMILDTPIPGIDGWDEIQGDPRCWHIHFMQVPNIPEELVAGRQAAYFGYFFQFSKFTPDEEAHFVQSYRTSAQLHAVFEIYRAFPADAQFNRAQRGPNQVPVFLGAGDESPFAKLVPKIAQGLRAGGCTHVETGLIPGAVHYVVEDQPGEVAALIEQYASLH